MFGLSFVVCGLSLEAVYGLWFLVYGSLGSTGGVISVTPMAAQEQL
jgi:hypothetical protein